MFSIKMRQVKHRKCLGVLLIVLASLFITGCSDFVDHDQITIVPEQTLVLDSNNTVGQTFVARHGGLNGIELWLKSQPGSTGVLRLYLQPEPNSPSNLAIAELSLETIEDPGFYRFSFPPDNSSHGVYRYVFLELEGSGTVHVATASGDTYIDGAAYRNHKPLDVQLTFRLIYSPLGIVLEIGRTLVEWTQLAIVSVFLYLLPGYSLLVWFNFHSDSILIRIALAVGLSLAIYPLLLLWTDLFGLQLGILYAWGPVILGTVILVLHYWRRYSGRVKGKLQRDWIRSASFWPDLTLVVIISLVFCVRLLVVRTLDAPMWGDSYQHAVIAQLLVDNGGLFTSWMPYTPYQSLTVHFGFSSLVAIFSWMTGVEIANATLLTGQIINVLAVLTLYPLSVHLAKGNRWAGVGAVLIAGTISPMPAYYVNWGRFAQLSGQVLLPVALYFILDIMHRARFAWRSILLAGLTLGGMSLHYYRMPFYYMTFILVWLVGWVLLEWKTNRYRLPSMLFQIALVAVCALFLILPWIKYIQGGRLANDLIHGTIVSTVSVWERVLADYQIWRNVFWYVPWPLLSLVLLTLIWALLRREWNIIKCFFWIIGLSALVLGRLAQIPGTNLMQNFAVLIALYIPVSLMVGWLIGEVAQRLSGQNMTILLLALALWFARGQINIVDPSFILVTRPDRHAMAWIQENIPNNARFLVEGFRIYGGLSAVGADAGWWIPLLAKRENTMPPQYALLNEVAIEPGYSQRVVDLVAHLEKYTPTSPEGLTYLCEMGVTHIYIGQGQGKVGAGAIQLFSPEVLIGSSDLQLLYHRDRVWIFALNRDTCVR